jgi:UDP-2,3-diacylglucosamine pyrophosphatase LpxH
VELVVISDVHLGTFGCRAKALNQYLKSIEPKILVLNGDIIDIWQFRKNYWPKAHMKVVQRLFKLMSEGVKIYYLTGNHDELLRKFTDFKMGNLEVLNKLVLDLDGKKAWFFHGDVFDITMKNSKWLAKLGGLGYDLLILLNSSVNRILGILGRDKVSFSKRIKQSVKQAVKFIHDFEITAMDIARENGYDYVICGHIHQPEIKTFQHEKGFTTYLNSGDWVENLTSLEYNQGNWTLYREKENKFETEDDEINPELPNNFQLIQNITGIR